MSFDTEIFITEMESRPCLWNSFCAEYADRKLRAECWGEIIEIFKEKDDMSELEKRQFGDVLQKKWKSIRGCYTRELNRQKNVKLGTDAGPRKNEYIFFQQLQFLKNVVILKDSDITPISEGNAEDSQDVDVKYSKRLKTEETSSSEDECIKTLTHSSKKYKEDCKSSEHNEDKMFLLSLLSTLERVPPEIKMSTKIKIMSILDQATQRPNHDEAGPSGPAHAKRRRMRATYKIQHSRYKSSRQISNINNSSNITDSESDIIIGNDE